MHSSGWIVLVWVLNLQVAIFVYTCEALLKCLPGLRVAPFRCPIHRPRVTSFAIKSVDLFK